MKKLLILLTAFLTACAPLASCGGNEISENTSEISKEPEKLCLDGAKLVVFGDSITALGSWGRSAAQELNTNFFNGAMGGITSKQGIDRFDAFVASKNPDIVTLLFGMNDLIMEAKNQPRVTPEKFKENLKTLVKKVKDLGATPVLLTTNPLDPNRFYAAQGQTPDWYSEVGSPLEWLDVYNAKTRELAAEEGVLLVDMRAACEGVAYTELLSDGIHLAAKGNEIFKNTLVKAFEENFTHKENAEKIDLDADFIKVEDSSSPLTLVPMSAEGWYIADKTTMAVKAENNSLIIMNKNGLWPDTIALPPENVGVPVENGIINYDIKIASAGASLILYFGGGTPNAYTESQYIILNKYIGETESYTGDLLPNQTLKGALNLKDLPLPASAIKDGRIIFSGVKLYVAGQSYSPVTINELSASIK